MLTKITGHYCSFVYFAKSSEGIYAVDAFLWSKNNLIIVLVHLLLAGPGWLVQPQVSESEPLQQHAVIPHSQHAPVYGQRSDVNHESILHFL